MIGVAISGLIDRCEVCHSRVMTPDTLLPIARRPLPPTCTEPAPQHEPPNVLRMVIGVTLGALAGLAVDLAPLIDWWAGL